MAITIEYKGESRSLYDWSKITGIGYTTIWGRYKKGWSPERILSKENCQKEATSAEDEEWRQVFGYEGLYEVSQNGLIRTFYGKKPHYLNPSINCRDNRMSVMLSKDGKSRRISVHRIVALAFVENPDPAHFTEINHKDENPQNNKAENLEWCDRNYNMHYNNLPQRITRHRKGLIAFNDDKELIFESFREAKKHGFDSGGIWAAIHEPLKDGKSRMYKGFYWRYKNGD